MKQQVRASREDGISGLRYALLVASRQIIDAQAGRNEPSTVLLVKGSLVTIFCMCLIIGAELLDPFREQCAENAGYGGRRSRIELQTSKVVTYPSTLGKASLTITRPSRSLTVCWSGRAASYSFSQDERFARDDKDGFFPLNLRWPRCNPRE